jgi:two-component system response regulator TctD
MAKRILLVEDNQDMRDYLRSFLAEDGYFVYAVGSAEDAIDASDERQFDIGLIDINLPGKSGFQLVEYIRSEGHDYPLIAMTARDATIDKVRGFDLGLTDYVVKPFDLMELRARMQAHMRTKKSGSVQTKNFSLDTKSFSFSAYGKQVELTQLEMKIMELLMQNNHALVKLDDLIEYAWGDQADMISPPIRIHISNIRKKIGDHDYRVIKTLPGVGYILHDPSEDLVA